MTSHNPATTGAGHLLRILHLSDTHNMHRSIETNFGPMPDADILLHTGDFTNDGTEAEYADFHDWLTSLKPRYKHILVIPGNHDLRESNNSALAGTLDPKKVLHPGFIQSKLPNVKVLHHETVNIEGLTIYGSSWDPWHVDACPENGASQQADRNFMWEAKEDKTEKHRYDQIPPNTHIYMTHGPPMYLLDFVGEKTDWAPKGNWGSSAALRGCIEALKPQVHCFGHLHEQRGFFWKDPSTGKFAGGVEYERLPGEGPFATIEVPSASYPCQLISNNSMLNHYTLEETNTRYLKGPPRLIIAERTRALYDPKKKDENDEKTENVEPSPQPNWICNWKFTVAIPEKCNIALEDFKV